MSNVELWLHDGDPNLDTHVIKGAQVVPPVGANIDLPWGRRAVAVLHYDYAITGECRVHVMLERCKS
jgi:hypothetical protein